MSVERPKITYKVEKRDGMLRFRAADIPRRSGRSTVFLDRDGVINRRTVDGYVTHWDEFIFLPGVKEALRRLTNKGFQLVIVSNQAGVAKGALSCRDLIHITKASLAELNAAGVRVDGAYFCLHQPADACLCRKPKPGLLIEVVRVHRVDLCRSYLIGDSPSDVAAGAEMGCVTVYVGEEDRLPVPASYRAKTVVEAADWIISKKS